eukprot:gene47-641_t
MALLLESQEALISLIDQKWASCEAARFYLVASNNGQTRFRILKIDRTEPTELVLIDDKVEYNQKQIRNLLQMIDVGNRPKASRSYDKGVNGLHHRGSAFGIVGFVRFLEGYYMILISKRRRVALIGGHTIYKIDDTVMIPIPNDQAKVKFSNPDEAKYLRIFQNVDLSSNFYFSYSYDPTHTLQYNLAPDFGLPTKFRDPTSKEEYGDEKQSAEVPHEDFQNVEEAESIVFEDGLDADLIMPCSTSEESDELVAVNNADAGKAKDSLTASKCSSSKNLFDDGHESETTFTSQLKTGRSRMGNSVPFRGRPYEKFVWNIHLLDGFKDQVHPDWILYIIHGFVGQSNICVYGKPIYVTLIARRSNQFAGTRFLKRGANDEGFVANDVETEQIAHDASFISLKSGRYTSYTQIRGSAPFFWSQDTSQGRIVPKPQILVDRTDPYYGAAALHFNNLMARFGAPIIILNLVKKKERRPHEQILSENLKQIVDYLNQFLPPDFGVQYIAWDMARVSKSKEINVIERLGEIAERILKETGFFHSGPQLFCNEIRSHSRFDGMKGFGYTDQHPGLRQTGILRVNCVDCLDRTNTAQFMVGKCALGFQLYALGVTDSPHVKFDSDAVRVLEELFEAHGDTLAVQYGGSQMVHRIRTYRKISPWTSHSRDIMQTVSRYYSNAFTDSDKQQAINLFLGVYVPMEGKPNLWDLPTDYYLHHCDTRDLTEISVKPSYTKWWSEDILKALPFPREEEEKMELVKTHEIDNCDEHEETLDIFSEYYRPFELTEFDCLYSHNLPTSCRDFMPASSSDPSPFIVRARGRGVEPGGHPGVPPRKAIVGSPSAPDDLPSSDEESSTDDEKSKDVSPAKKENAYSDSQTVSFQELLPTMSDVYGMEPKQPPTEDIELYKRYSDMRITSQPVKGQKRAKSSSSFLWKQTNRFEERNSSKEIAVPIVAEESKHVYDMYLKTGILGPSDPPEETLNMYSKYVAQKYM